MQFILTQIGINNSGFKISGNNFPNNEFENLPFETHFNFTKINSLFSNLSSLTIWSLIELREDYKSLKYSTKELDIHLNKLVSYPLYVTLMSIIS